MVLRVWQGWGYLIILQHPQLSART